MRKKPGKHMVTNKYGKAFTRGAGAVKTQRDKMLGQMRAQYEKVLGKMTKKRTQALAFTRGSRAAEARDKIAQYFASKFGANRPIGIHYSMATNRVKLLKGSIQQRKEAMKSLKRLYTGGE